MASVRSTHRALTSSRLSERSERSSRSELATRPWDRAPQGTPPARRGAASEAADGGPPAAHSRTQTKLSTTACPAAALRRERSMDQSAPSLNDEFVSLG